MSQQNGQQPKKEKITQKQFESNLEKILEILQDDINEAIKTYNEAEEFKAKYYDTKLKYHTLEYYKEGNQMFYTTKKN